MKNAIYDPTDFAAGIDRIATTWSDEVLQQWLNGRVKIGQPHPKFTTKAPDHAWRERFTAMQSARLNDLPAALNGHVSAAFTKLVRAGKLELAKQLVLWGGWDVCQPALDIDMPKIFTRGILLKGEKAKLKLGAPSSCHENSAERWLDNPDRTVMMTGYALTDDGLWRQHSWTLEFGVGASKGLSLVETTSKRLAYFGFPLTSSEVMAFIQPSQSEAIILQNLESDLKSYFKNQPVPHPKMS
jgi:hypothetical protein